MKLFDPESMRFQGIIRILLSASIIGGGTIVWMLLHGRIVHGLSTFIAFWPALFLARIGVWRTWLTLPASLLLISAILCWLTKRRGWTQHCLLSTLVLVVYCVIGQTAHRFVAWETPSTNPYSGDAQNSREYVVGYRFGYKWGLAGIIRSYCFASEAETDGFRDGFDAGLSVHYRFLGKEQPLQRQQLNKPIPDAAMKNQR